MGSAGLTGEIWIPLWNIYHSKSTEALHKAVSHEVYISGTPGISGNLMQKVPLQRCLFRQIFISYVIQLFKWFFIISIAVGIFGPRTLQSLHGKNWKKGHSCGDTTRQYAIFNLVNPPVLWQWSDNYSPSLLTRQSWLPAIEITAERTF